MVRRWCTVLVVAASLGAVQIAQAGAATQHPQGSVVVNVGEAPSAIDGTGGVLYVANTLSDSVSVVDAVHARVLRTVSVPAAPTAVAVDGANLWVAMANGTVDRYSRTTWHRQVHLTGFQVPIAMLFSGRRAWVLDQGANTVTVVNRTTGATIGQFGTGGTGASAMVLSGSHLLVADADSDSVTELDPATGASQATIAVSGSPVAMAQVGSLVWVVRKFDYTALVLDPVGQAVVHRYPTAGLKTDAVATVGNHVFIASAGTNLVMDLRPATGKIYRGHRTGRAPGAMCVQAGRLWVVNVASRSIEGITW